MTGIVKPIHVATINGHQLRLYRTPNNDGRPDLPWHSIDDLGRVFGLNRQRRRVMLEGMQRYGCFRTIATTDGLVTIGPHYAAQGAISAIAEIVGDAKSKHIESEYGYAFVEACKKLVPPGLAFPSDSYLKWMRDAMHRHEDAGATS
jgi:hypothetical protein